MAHKSPKELIELYWTEVWNNRNVELIRELCADPIIRHDPGSTTPLSVEDQIARVRQQSDSLHPYFEHEVLHADDEFVTSVWNMHTRKGTALICAGLKCSAPKMASSQTAGTHPMSQGAGGVKGMRLCRTICRRPA